MQRTGYAVGTHSEGSQWLTVWGSHHEPLDKILFTDKAAADARCQKIHAQLGTNWPAEDYPVVRKVTMLDRLYWQIDE